MHCNFANKQLWGDLDVKLGNQIIPQVTKFKYLRSIIWQDGEIDVNVNHKIQSKWCKWRKATEIICDRKIPHKVKGKFYCIAIITTVLCGSECWAAKRQHEHKMGCWKWGCWDECVFIQERIRFRMTIY